MVRFGCPDKLSSKWGTIFFAAGSPFLYSVSEQHFRRLSLLSHATYQVFQHIYGISTVAIT